MDQITHQVRLANWTKIIEHCSNRPQGTTAKANNLKPYDYFEYLLTEIPKHLDDTDRSFLDDLLPWSPSLPANCRKPEKR